MKEIKALTRQIEAARTNLQRVIADHQQALDTIDSDTRYDDQLSALRSQRQMILAKALVAKKNADTTKVDGDIQAAEAQQAAAQSAAAVARDALPIYEQGLYLARTELANLDAQQRAAVEAQILAAHDAGLARYLQAVADMQAAVEDMVGAQVAWQTALGAGKDQPFPGRGKRVLGDLCSRGVRVPWDHSRLKDPKVSSEYTDDFREFWYVPAWADPETPGLGDACAKRLIDEVREAGFACGEYIGTESVPPVKIVKVRVVHGTISSRESVLRLASTGEIISRKDRSFGPGESLELEESYARGLAARGMVVIHGEEPAKPASDAAHRNTGRLIEPQTNRRVGLTGSR
jgi:hypothetical protein